MDFGYFFHKKSTWHPDADTGSGSNRDLAGLDVMLWGSLCRVFGAPADSADQFQASTLFSEQGAQRVAVHRASCFAMTQRLNSEWIHGLRLRNGWRQVGRCKSVELLSSDPRGSRMDPSGVGDHLVAMVLSQVGSISQFGSISHGHIHGHIHVISISSPYNLAETSHQRKSTHPRWDTLRSHPKVGARTAHWVKGPGVPVKLMGWRWWKNAQSLGKKWCTNYPSLDLSRFDDLMMYNHVQPLGCFMLFHLAFSSLQACLTAQHLWLCFEFLHSFSFIVLPCFPDLIYNAGQTLETCCADNLIDTWTYQNTQLRTLRACTQNPWGRLPILPDITKCPQPLETLTDRWYTC